MNRYVLVATSLCLSLAGSAFADTKMPAKTDTTAKSNKGMSASKMTCQDFIALEDVQRPKAVYWAEGLNKKGKVEDAVFDVDSMDRIVPVLVEDCKATPSDAFVKKAKTASMKK